MNEHVARIAESSRIMRSRTRERIARRAQPSRSCTRIPGREAPSGRDLGLRRPRGPRSGHAAREQAEHGPLNQSSSQAMDTSCSFRALQLPPLGGRAIPGSRSPKGRTACVDKLVGMGIADPDRLAVIGRGTGGCATYAVVTYTTRFKAAIALSEQSRSHQPPRAVLPGRADERPCPGGPRDGPVHGVWTDRARRAAVGGPVVLRAEHSALLLGSCHNRGRIVHGIWTAHRSARRGGVHGSLPTGPPRETRALLGRGPRRRVARQRAPLVGPDLRLAREPASAAGDRRWARVRQLWRARTAGFRRLRVSPVASSWAGSSADQGSLGTSASRTAWSSPPDAGGGTA